MHGQFDSPISLGTADSVPVRGPLTGVDPEADQATIVCLLVQDGAGGANPVWAEGRGTWTKGAPKWEGEVSREGRVIGGGGQRQPLRPGHPARGIAIAIAVKEEPIVGDKIVPPSIDTLTWCVDVQLVP
jgi:hypothetical protein